MTTDDRGDIVLGWLTKLVVVLGLLGIVGFDGVALVQSRFQAADRATTAASAAATDFATSKDPQKAYDAAFATLVDGDTIETTTFTVGTDGTVTLRLHHATTTLLLHKVGPLKKYGDAVGTGTARPSS
ncbi:MAG: hypothetical protein ABR614_01895 [Mycobacteriales bacterium]